MYCHFVGIFLEYVSIKTGWSFFWNENYQNKCTYVFDRSVTLSDLILTFNNDVDFLGKLNVELRSKSKRNKGKRNYAILNVTKFTPVFVKILVYPVL